MNRFHRLPLLAALAVGFLAVSARAQFAAGQRDAARKLLAATLAEVSGLPNPDVSRGPHVSTLLTWAELFGSESLPTS